MASEGLVLRSHGTIIAARAPAPILELLAAGLPTGAAIVAGESPPPDATYDWTIRRDGRRPPRHVVRVRCRRYPGPYLVARTTRPDEALRRLVHDAEFRIAMYAPDDVFVHAAAVAWMERAIVIPGASFSGKSRLTAALLRAGATYLSDEYAVFTPDGRVSPFARQLMLRDADGLTSARRHAADFGARVATMPLPLGAVLLTRWERDARWAPHAVTRAAAMFALLEHAVDVRARPAHTFARLPLALREGVLALAGVRGDADETAVRLLAQLDAAWRPRQDAG